MAMKYLLSFLLALPLAAQWADLPGTTLQAVAPVACAGAGTPAAYCSGNTATYSFNVAAYNVMNAWGGAAADTVHNQLIVTGGGHSDYNGNEVYSLNLNLPNPTMTRQTNPSGPYNATGQANADGTPVSRHSSGGLVYLPNEDAVLYLGYGVGPTPLPATTAWWYSRAAKSWTQKGALPDMGNNTGWLCALDTTQASESVVCVDLQYNNLFRYTPASDTWTTLGSGTAKVPYLGNCVVHPDQKVMICIGPASGQAAGIYSISLKSPYSTTNITSSTSGCSALYGVNGPGLDFDSSTGLIVGYTGSGNSVVLFDVISGICQTKTFSGGPSTSGYAAGMFGRLAYFPKLNKHVIVNNATGDAFTLTLHASSLGRSTITCKDIDGDGYGVGPGCLGPDGDDSDAAVHSSAQIISAYGSIQNYLLHIGYQNAGGLSNVWCISPNGDDTTGSTSTNADTACGKPYKTWNAAGTALVSHGGPYIVLFRSGTYTQNIATPPSGTASVQNILMSYPGELATEDFSAGSGTTINLGGVAYITVDGLKIKGNASGPGYLGGTYILYQAGSQTITAIGQVLVRCEVFAAGNDSNVNADNVILTDIEENVVHDVDSSAQHNIYLGSNTVGSSGVIVSRNIMYNVSTGGYPNLQFNGRCTGCRFEQNIIYNQDGQGMAFLMGVSNSFIRSNLVFNTGTGSGGSNNPPRNFTFLNYDSGQCKQPGLPSICAWDQTNNVVENNTLWAGTQGINGSGTMSGYTFTVNNQTTGTGMSACGADESAPCGNLGGNFYRNNVIVDLSGSSTVPAVYYPASNVTNYLALDTWANNVIVNSAGAPTIVASVAGVAKTCAQFNAAALSGSGCSNGDPLFVAANASFYNTPASFNFALATGSPAVGAGTATGASPFDIWGTVLASPSSIGSIEPAGQAPLLSCDLNGDGVTNVIDVQSAINQALHTSACTTADLDQNGQCTVVDVQRVITASLGGACRTGP